ncbi:MAG: aminomethyl transferase family protein, partial [Halobacteriales archaeon]|nr:aminomethyl transferase family protein [Halobacteriales archaeon]
MTATDLITMHEDHGAAMTEIGGQPVVRDYGRPARTHRAVRNGVGVIEQPYGVIVVEGSDRVSYVDNIVSNQVPEPDEGGCYAVICSPQGLIEVDLYIYSGAERVLILTPPGRAQR